MNILNNVIVLIDCDNQSVRCIDLLIEMTTLHVGSISNVFLFGNTLAERKLNRFNQHVQEKLPGVSIVSKITKTTKIVQTNN